MVVVVQFQFKSGVLGLSQIPRRHIDAYPLRTSQIRGEDIFSSFVEVVDITVQQSVPKSEFNSGIVLVRTLPSHSVVRILTFVDSGIPGCPEMIRIIHLCPYSLV